jgi:hypothetical protein
MSLPAITKTAESTLTNAGKSGAGILNPAPETQLIRLTADSSAAC